MSSSNPAMYWLEAFSGLFALITKTIPSDELQLERFKVRHPKIYARIQKHLLNEAEKYCKRKGFFEEREIKAYCKLIQQTPEFETLLIARMNPHPPSAPSPKEKGNGR